MKTSLAGLEVLDGDRNVEQPVRICVIRMALEGKEDGFGRQTEAFDI